MSDFSMTFQNIRHARRRSTFRHTGIRYDSVKYANIRYAYIRLASDKKWQHQHKITKTQSDIRLGLVHIRSYSISVYADIYLNIHSLRHELI